jgi:hypothetical protein
MAMGMEMLVSTVIKSLGIDPEVLISQGTEFTKQIAGKIKEFDVRLYDLENQNAQLIAQNAAFIVLLQKAYPDIASGALPSVPQTEESE